MQVQQTMQVEPLGNLRRTHTCNQIRPEHVGQNVTLMGWVHRRRDLGGLIFLDLRDRYGITQCVIDPEAGEAFAKAERVRSEFVLAVTGKVAARTDKTINKNLDTGAVELVADSLLILNTSKPLPIPVAEDASVDESLRMQYRYLDLRRPIMSRYVLLRHKLAKAVRDYFDAQSFMEIETPMLMSSTPEGARDYLVPSRVNKGKFYALPQSPQIFKQLLMVSGQDRYFQIARCFRDEDLRADRQPEFTQIDIEMSFVGQEDVFAMVEGLVRHMWGTVMNVQLPEKFRRMPYSEAMERYGSDKPDLRFELDFHELELSGGPVSGLVKGFRVAGKGGQTRKEQDAWVELAKSSGLGGLFFASLSEGEIKSSVAKHVGEDALKAAVAKVGAQNGDLVVFAAHSERKKLNAALGKIRLEMGKKFDLMPRDRYEFSWVVDFPLYALNEETGKLEPEHHPFTSCHPDDFDKLRDNPIEARAAAYDLVLNGNELASGSIRIHNREMQIEVLSKTGLTYEEIHAKFGFLLDAFEYGAPPHGGIALGLDRLVTICAGVDSIREVIVFPKNQQAQCLLTNAPVDPTQEQLDILALKIDQSKVG
ncbi:MAG: aspartate--tRNA ligase [Vulcanimicrobiota bacterium]